MKLHRTNIQLRFSDIDMLQHVNNARFASFMELARIAYFNDIIAPRHNWKETGLIVARLETDFRIPVYLYDRLTVETWVSSIGLKSITIDYHFVTEGDTAPVIKASGRSVMVCFQYTEQRSIPVPHEWRKRINDWQGTTL